MHQYSRRWTKASSHRDRGQKTWPVTGQLERTRSLGIVVAMLFAGVAAAADPTAMDGLDVRMAGATGTNFPMTGGSARASPNIWVCRTFRLG